MEWLTGIIALFKLIPVLSQDVRDLLTYFRKAEEAGWFNKLNETFKPLEGPTTKEQKDAASKAISDSIKSL